MRIEEINEDKNLIRLNIVLDEDDIRKIKNTAYLYQLTALNPIYEKNINKEAFEKVFNINDVVNNFGSQFEEKIQRYIKDNTEYDYFLEPLTEESFAELEAEKPIEFKAVLEPKFDLLDYKNELTFPSFKIDEEELETKLGDRLDELQKQNVRLEPTEKPFEEGNTVSADIEMIFQGQLIRKEDNEILTTEEIKGLMDLEKIIGKNIDDEVNSDSVISTTLKINQIYNPDYPELDDDFAAEISEFDTLDELKDEIRKDITEELRREYLEKRDQEALEKLVKETSLNDLNSTELIEIKNSDQFNDYVTRAVTGNQSSSGEVSRFENLIDYKLIHEIFKKLIENENIDITDQVETIYQKLLDGEEVGDEILPQTVSTVKQLLSYKDIGNHDLIKELVTDDITQLKAIEIIKESIKEED